MHDQLVLSVSKPVLKTSKDNKNLLLTTTIENAEKQKSMAKSLFTISDSEFNCISREEIINDLTIAARGCRKRLSKINGIYYRVYVAVAQLCLFAINRKN